jgi:light-regulated signal transduction histidine kinase (bacteriophytochrome)
MIDDILALSRSTRQELTRERVNLSAYVEAIIGDLRDRDPDRSVTVEIEPNLTVWGDARLLRSVLDNLLSNAWKFTSKKDEARIEFGASSTGNERVYFLRDNGAGFDMAYVDKLFGIFQRLHAATEFEGNGVGLATVVRLVGRHGGRVWAEGEVNKGASFYFTLDS